ncbi:hypothetical protein NUW58_g10873 [Xylaria curta]|uniref:Uncharacterized protein n=1 Tax=Xylaria curta TaxID=42375 RepID=A0ACC1MFR7_9PEZI|nr:hypothetical protein NUW58_g10873 [Xylaria curta]
MKKSSPCNRNPKRSSKGCACRRLDGDNDNGNDNDSRSDSTKSDDQAEDPFDAASVDVDSEPASRTPLSQTPPNPFARTLQDIEGTGKAHDASATATGTSSAKGAIDVDSFKRLLLTGYANLPNPAQPAAGSAGAPAAVPHTPGFLPDGASATDASSISKHSIVDALQETPRTSHEISESETPEDRKGVLPSSPLATIPSASARKKPPPPNSRHGKLIKIELGASSDSSGTPRAAMSGPSSLPSPFGTTPRKVSSESTTSLPSPPRNYKRKQAPSCTPCACCSRRSSGIAL